MIGDKQREDMRDFLVKAFADGVLGEAELESRLSSLETLSDPSELRAMVEAVRSLYPEPYGERADDAPAPAGASAPALSPAREAARLPDPSPAERASGADVSVDPPVQLLRGQGMNAKRKGRWFTSERIRIELERSNMILDFSELASFPGIFMEIELDLRGCNVVMKFPKGTELRNEIEGIGSNVHVTHSGDNLYRLNVVLYGTAEGTNLRAKTKAMY